MNISLGKKAKKSMSFEKFCEAYGNYYVKRGSKKHAEMRADWERETGKKVGDVQKDDSKSKKAKDSGLSTESV